MERSIIMRKQAFGLAGRPFSSLGRPLPDMQPTFERSERPSPAGASDWVFSCAGRPSRGDPVGVVLPASEVVDAALRAARDCIHGALFVVSREGTNTPKRHRPRFKRCYGPAMTKRFQAALPDKEC